MPIILEDRLSDSPFVERIWRSRSENISSFISIAAFHWDFVIWKQDGKTYVNIQGPETQATRAPVPEDAEFFGIVFKPGVHLPHFPAHTLVNNNVSLPLAANQAFWLKSDAWQLPTYENADTFVDHLVKEDLIAHEPAVEAAIQGYPPDMSLRSLQRRFLHTTGLSYRTMQQIERARRATILLQQGMPILDAVYEFGYFDQAHLTKSLKHFIGQTPTQLADLSRAEQLSLLYKTDSFC
jgi:AraC-like DNA-binding protein